MFHPGLVSISFRNHSPQEIIMAAANQHLKYIEWGSDLHAPPTELSKLEHIAALQHQYGIACCSYGTYFRLGYTPLQELPQYINAAKALAANILRVWAGRKKASDCTEEERAFLLSQCHQAAALAEEHRVILCLECHRRSYTETAAGALELMHQVNSPNFKMYWQPNPDISLEANLEYIAAVQQHIMHIHVFHWVGADRLPLKEGIGIWKNYLSQLYGNHHLLLEFMPDDQMSSLETEAHSLHQLILETQNEISP